MKAMRFTGEVCRMTLDSPSGVSGEHQIARRELTDSRAWLTEEHKMIKEMKRMSLFVAALGADTMCTTRTRMEQELIKWTAFASHLTVGSLFKLQAPLVTVVRNDDYDLPMFNGNTFS
ncbi:hypothetical protein ACEPAG_8885 [Sanghuangporus baumii]